MMTQMHVCRSTVDLPPMLGPVSSRQLAVAWLVEGSGRSSSAETPSPPTAACAAINEVDVVHRLEDLLLGVEDLAPRLSRATLEAAADRLRSLAAASAEGMDLTGDSPLRPERRSEPLCCVARLQRPPAHVLLGPLVF